MKTIFIVLFFLLCFQTTKAQLIVMNDKMNIVYFGVDNPISFSVNGYDSKHLILKASCGELRKTEDGYRWKTCSDTARFVTFRCYLKKSNKISNLGQADFRIKTIPDLPIILNYPAQPDGVHRARMFDIRYLRVAMISFDFDVSYSVVRFEVEILKKNGDTLLYHNTGPELSVPLREELAKLIEGKQVCFKSVMVKNVACESEELKLVDKCDVYYE